jgi:PKD repeat protein
MKKRNTSESGIFNLRLRVSVLLACTALWMSLVAFAAPSPAGGTLSTAKTQITYSDNTGAPPNPTAVATGKPTCGPTGALCSTFNLTIDASVGTTAAGYDPSQYQIVIQWQWSVPTVDYDWFVEDSNGAVIAKNQSTADPSSVILPTTTAPGVYQLIGTLSTGAPIPYTGTITLQPKPTGSAGICAAPADCTPPRYMSYEARSGQAEDAGEPSLGVDWNPNDATLKHDKVNTGGVAFFTSGPHEWRVDFDDCSSPAIYNWQGVSALTTQQFVLSDPIGFVDHYSSAELGLSDPPPHTPGRVFTLDLIGGEGDSLGSYSDDDGKSYLPGGTGGAGAGPDHETLGGGPYASPIPATKALNSYPNAIYYCSQNIVAEAQCSRSDDGGQTFGASVPIFSPSQCTGGIHGHVKVAPDGTVYVPNSSCGTVGTAGVAVSTDNGITWTENNVPGSTSTQDPSVGVGQNSVGKPGGNLNGTNTVYIGYVDGDGRALVARSGNRGVDWSTPVDVGAPFGVTHAVFPVVVTGDDNRASFAFLGTGNGISTDGKTCDPYGATLNCGNVWHLYISTTYDGGQNWITIDGTPDDPVQTGTICLQGTTCAGGRNLLDFNDFAIDAEGRGLVGYADGCVGCANTFNGQSSASRGDVTRQSGGRRLFAKFDPIEPAPPAAPQMVSAVLEGTGEALITWLQPDNGGSTITGYNVYRGTSTGGETLLTSVSGETTTKYIDPAPPAGNVFYYVTAVNARGESTHCRELSLAPGGPLESACVPPGLTELTDPAGDTSAALGIVTTPAPPGSDLLSFQLSQPYEVNGVILLNFTINTDPGESPQPPGSAWYVAMKIGSNYKGVHMAWKPTSPTTPVFESYTPGPNNSGGVDGRFVTPGSEKPAEPTSSYLPPYNQVVIVVKASDLGLNPGDKIDGFVSGVSQSTDPGATIGKGATALYDEMPDGLGFTGSYTVNDNQACRPNSPPVAQLSATPMSGTAPLLVHFSGEGSSDPDTAAPADTIASYTFNFGDGSAVVTKTCSTDASCATADHTYNSAGDYPARLVVTDSRGKSSTNIAQVVISVAAPAENQPPTADLQASPTSGQPPLTVSFDATGSKDPDFQDTIASYTFRFGDGSPDLTTGDPRVDHTYQSDGTYAARLVVTDSRGAKSSNIAQQTITVTLAASSPSPSPSASASPGPSGTPSPSASPSTTPTATPSPSPTNVSLLNISGRVVTQNGDNVGIGGFIITGGGTKRIMARALGPSLKVSGVPVNGRIQDPILEMHDSNGNVLTNDNWRSDQEAEIQDSGLAPSDDHEAAIVKRLPAGNYTAIIKSADGTAGIGLIELFDLSSSDPGELGNLSVRALVQTDDNVLIDGVILRGGNPKRVLFRALGPELHDRGVTGELQDPTLDLYDANGTLLRNNDNWKDAPNANDIQATGLAPTDDHESAILMTLSAGNYTSIVRGANRTSGVSLNEAFKFDN